MKPTELIAKVLGPTKGHYPDDASNSAKAAFLANLSQELKIDESGIEFSPHFRPNDPEVRSRYQLLWYAGMIVGYGQDIPETAIKYAHCAMVLPSNRAVVSDALGYEKVTGLGVPQEYGVHS